MKRQRTINIIIVFISLLIGLILSVVNIVSLGWLQLCQFEGRLLLEYYYLVPAVLFLVLNTFLYIRCRETDLNAGLIILEIMLLCSNIWFVCSFAITLDCSIDSAAERIYSGLYYIVLSCNLVFPMVFLCMLIIRYCRKKYRR